MHKHCGNGIAIMDRQQNRDTRFWGSHGVTNTVDDGAWSQGTSPFLVVRVRGNSHATILLKPQLW